MSLNSTVYEPSFFLPFILCSLQIDPHGSAMLCKACSLSLAGQPHCQSLNCINCCIWLAQYVNYELQRCLEASEGGPFDIDVIVQTTATYGERFRPIIKHRYTSCALPCLSCFGRIEDLKNIIYGLWQVLHLRRDLERPNRGSDRFRYINPDSIDCFDESWRIPDRQPIPLASAIENPEMPCQHFVCRHSA